MNPPQSVLSPGPSIQGHIIYHCAETRTIIIDGGILNLSHTDYRLLMLLLQHSESALPFVSFIELKQCFKDSQVNLRRSLSRRINILRERLWSYGLDIVNLRGQGYTLLLQPLHMKSASVLPERDDLPNIVSEGQRGGPPESMAS